MTHERSTPPPTALDAHVAPDACATTDSYAAPEDRLQPAHLHAAHTHAAQLQAALSEARGLFEHSPGAAYLLSAQGRVLDVNRRGAGLLGSSKERLVGHSLLPALVPSSQLPFTALLARVCGGRGLQGEGQTAEIQLLTPDGPIIEAMLEARGLPRPGEATRCHLTLTDVTAFKQAHRTLWDTQQAQETELRQQALRLRRLHDEFEDVLTLAGRELGGDLTRAERVLALWRRQPDAPGHLDHLEETLRHSRNLLDSLRQYTQVRFLRVRARRVNLKPVFAAALRELNDQTLGRDVQITALALPTLQGDSQVLQTILREYLSNALKFTRERPQARLHIVVQEDEAEHRIGLEDNGVGFNMRQKEKAFELFGRLHSGRQYEGTGLGLAMVRQLCERFGGRAWGEGKVGQGATFWFAWPKEPLTREPR